MLLKDAPGNSTSVSRSLDRQIIHQLNLLIPSRPLVDCSDLNIRPGGDAVWVLLQKDAKEALARVLNSRKEALTINSAYRTIAQQYFLYENKRRLGLSRVAPVGMSNHQGGLAIDIGNPMGWRAALERENWRWFGASDNMHFSYKGEGNPDSQAVKSAAVKGFQILWNLNNPRNQILVDGLPGANTLRCLGNSPIEGFPNGDFSPVMPLGVARLMQLSQPMVVGAEVLKLQQNLVKLGYTLTPDGFFGVDTDKVVKAFQKDNGLEPDGIVGAMTLKIIAEKLNNLAQQ